MHSTKAKEVALTGMLFALAITLSFFESSITPLLGLMPAMKLGLSNVVVMFALLYLNRRTALLLTVLKSGFAFLTRGATAGFLSFCGGVLSWGVMALLLCFPVTEYIFSVSGALAHNLGQLIGAALVLNSSAAFGYGPVLLFTGIAVGACTALLGKRIFPILCRIAPKKDRKKNLFKNKNNS